MLEGRGRPGSARLAALSLVGRAHLRACPASPGVAGQLSTSYQRSQMRICNRITRRELRGTACPLERRPSRPVVGARTARRVVDHAAAVEETAGRLEAVAAVQAPEAADPAATLGATIPDETKAVAEAGEGGRRMAVPRAMTDQATGMVTTSSLRVEEAVALLRHHRRTRCLEFWRG